ADTSGAGGLTVSRTQVTFVVEVLPASSVAVTVREYSPSPWPVVSKMPFAGQLPEKTVAPPGPVSTQVSAIPDSVSEMATNGVLSLVGSPGPVTAGAGGLAVSPSPTPVRSEVLPASSVAVTVRE